MRFLLTLECKELPVLLPANYQHPLSAAIYHIIQNADPEFSAFLHETGYGKGFHSFKLFTYSDIVTPFKMQGDRMKLLNNEAEVNICFYLPDVAENFIKVLFMNQQIEISDKESGVGFHISQIEGVVEDLNFKEYK